jgi:hypothetical protein
MASPDPRLIQAVQELDSGTRALLDLSLRRAISDEKVAGALGVEIAEIPRRRARGIAQLADKLAVPGPAELALLLVALPDLPEEAWGVPNPSLPKVTKVSKARRVRALRRVAVAASPLVAAAAVMAALIVSSGGDKSVQISATSGLGGKQHQPAAAAKAPARSPSRLGLPAAAATAPDIIASAQGPTPADLPKASSARTLRQRARHRHRARHHAKHHKAAPQTGPPSTDRFASSVPRPDAYVPPPKPVKKHKPHHHHHKAPTPTPEPTPQPDPTAPLTNNQTTAIPTPQQITTQPPVIKKPSLPSLHVGDDQTNKKQDGHDNGCGGSGHDNSRSGDQKPYGSQSDGSQSDNQSQADYQKAPDPKSWTGIFKKHRTSGYKS